MKFSLKDKTAIITGAGSGIGKAIAIALAEQGAMVHIVEINSGNAEETLARITEKGGRAKTHRCSVTSLHDVKEMVEGIARESPIDILVNNAGIAHIGNIEDTEESDLDRLYEVNIKGIYNCIRSCIPSMKKHGGVILNMGSIAGTVGLSDRFAYSMSKGAVLTMTYSVAKDYVEYGIRCNSISPARVHTPFVDEYLKENYPDNIKEMFEKLSKTQPIGRMGKPEEIANLAVYLCSDEASFITGTDFPIDGGFIKLNG